MKTVVVTNFCPFYRVRLYSILADRIGAVYLFFSNATEKTWEPLNPRGGPGLPVIPICLPDTPRWLVMLRLAETLWQGDYDVVIQGLSGRWAVLITWFFARLKRKPLVIWTGIWYYPRSVFHQLTFPLVRRMLRNADAVIAYGSHVCDFLVSLGVPSDRIFIGWNTADNSLYDKPVKAEELAEVRTTLGIGPGKVILFVGRLDEEKGLGYLLRSLEIINWRLAVTGCRLLVIGRGPKGAELKEFCADHQIGNVKFLDYVPNDRLYLYYRLAEVVVVPSVTTRTFREPWGLVVNEAMNQGTVVIASDAVGAARGGLLEHEKNGLVVPERDTEALANAIARVLKDTALRARLSEAARTAIAGWTYERMADGFVNAAHHAAPPKPAAEPRAVVVDGSGPGCSADDRHCRVLGVNLAVTDYEDVLDSVHSALAARKKLRLSFCNVHVTMVANEEPEVLAALNHPQALTVPDGMPVVWAMRAWGATIRKRVYGPDFLELCLKDEANVGFRHFFYGSTERTLDKLCHVVAARFPRAVIAGMHAPPFRPQTEAEEADTVAMINASAANIVWVALGAPKQEVWIARMADKLESPVLVAVGAGVDFIAGTVRQAPDWVQNCGLEWLYRLIQEPKRLWYRYCHYNPRFVITAVRERMRGRTVAKM